MSVVVVATFFPKPGTYDEVRAAIAEVAGLVQDEPGCELYSLHAGEDRLVLIEKWASQEALDIHSQGAPLAQLVERVTPLLAAELDIVGLIPAPAGDANKGVL